MVYTKVNNVSNVKMKATYIKNSKKTEGRAYASSLGVPLDRAADGFKKTREYFGGRHLTLPAREFTISFYSEDIRPAVAHEIGLRLANSYFKDYEALVCTHTDSETLHTHILINKVSYVTGKTYYTHRLPMGPMGYPYDYGFLGALKEICADYGIEVNENKQILMDSYLTWQAKKHGFLTGDDRFVRDMKYCISVCFSVGDFIGLMDERGYMAIIRDDEISFREKWRDGKCFQIEIDNKKLGMKELKEHIGRLLRDPDHMPLKEEAGPFPEMPETNDIRILYAKWVEALRLTGMGKSEPHDKTIIKRVPMIERYEGYLKVLDEENIRNSRDIDRVIEKLSGEIGKLDERHMELSHMNIKRKKINKAVKEYRNTEVPYHLYLKGVSEALGGYERHIKAERTILRAGIRGADLDKLVSEKQKLDEELKEISGRKRQKRYLIKKLLYIKEEINNVMELWEREDMHYYRKRGETLARGSSGRDGKDRS